MRCAGRQRRRQQPGHDPVDRQDRRSSDGFLGNLTGNGAFLALMGDTTIDGLAMSYRFDGAWTDVTAVPEPANVALLLAGLGLVGVGARRRPQAPNA